MGKVIVWLKNHRDVIIAFLASRIMFAILMLLSKNSYSTILELGDGLLYRKIAQFGYSEDYLVAFFPLIPIIIRYLGDIGMLIINQLAFLGTLFILKDLLAKEYNYSQTNYILLLFALSPMGFFSMLEYTESLFVFFTLSAFVLFKRKKHPLLMGILIGLSVVTRNVGSLLFFAIFVGMCLDMKRKETRFVDIITAYVPATLLSLSFPVYLQFTYGKWNAFVDIQYTDYLRIRSNFFKTLYWNLVYVFTDKFPHDGIDVLVLYKVSEFLSLLLMCFVILLIGREIRIMLKEKRIKTDSLVLVIFCALYIIALTSTIRDPLQDCPTYSFYRYYLAMFSVFVMLGKTPFRKDITRIFIYLMIMISIPTTIYFSRNVFFF
ncbi:MAG: hypothetical protein IKE09_06170 [Clostridiales bacterium]|nr:hypothetical protein [Clostridiales bacterium]